MVQLFEGVVTMQQPFYYRGGILTDDSEIKGDSIDAIVGGINKLLPVIGPYRTIVEHNKFFAEYVMRHGMATEAIKRGERLEDYVSRELQAWNEHVNNVLNTYKKR